MDDMLIKVANFQAIKNIQDYIIYEENKKDHDKKFIKLIKKDLKEMIKKNNDLTNKELFSVDKFLDKYNNKN